MNFIYNEKGECIGRIGIDFASTQKPDYSDVIQISKPNDFSCEIEIGEYFKNTHIINRWKHLSKYGKNHRIRQKTKR